ncbi:hypothetical protein KUCAC02_001438 [Chaenocephalus aceratus]|uniref:Uncharacterized protein n=1 Tax=Chaenocephalus aceratus TaxID=36190 RepID=A0ACB9XRZ4_CHAAC|nr:hypothetical protein KUCAC02_001438 [Chaenocephalus aceratus]
MMSTPKKLHKNRSKRKKTLSRLRSKLRHTEEKLLERTNEMVNLRKRLKRLENMPKRKQAFCSNEGREVQKNVAKRGPQRTLACNSKRRLMRTLVSRFLHHDEVTTIINGKSGEIRRKGQIFRKRALTDTMANLYKRFLSENPRHSLSKSQFFKLRPFWIGQKKVTDRETCACKIHENVGLKIKKLHQLGVIGTSSPRDIVQTIVCSDEEKSCIYRTCSNCKDKTIQTTLDPSTKGNIIVWEEWINKSVLVAQKSKDGSTQEREVRKVFPEKRHTSIVELTQDHLSNFSLHIYNIKHQFERLRKLRETLTQNDVVVHIDYSENYACKYTREIKETHFGGGNEQVTLHTGVIYLGSGRVESFASLSACLQHDAIATWAHLIPVLQSIRKEHPNARNIHFISDGPTSQYRNRTNFYLASTVPFMQGFEKVTWNFTEASHGKGAPDGVGGALKNLADRIVSYGTSIPDANTLFEQLKLNSSVRLFKITEEDINKSAELVPPALKAVLGTMRIHQVSQFKTTQLEVNSLSNYIKIHIYFLLA